MEGGKALELPQVRDFVWDFKITANKNAKGRKEKWVLLNDIRKTDQVISQESGIGYIIAKADFKFDRNGSFRNWRNRFQNRTSSSSNPRILKTEAKITDVFAIFIKNRHQLQQGINDRWIARFDQGRNTGGASRNPKYKINLDTIPSENIIRLE